VARRAISRAGVVTTPGDVALTVDASGAPQVAFVQPDDATTAATMVVSVFKDIPAAFAGGCKAITFKPADKAGNLVADQ
jgi:hypothetical protein